MLITVLITRPIIDGSGNAVYTEQHIYSTQRIYMKIQRQSVLFTDALLHFFIFFISTYLLSLT